MPTPCSPSLLLGMGIEFLETSRKEILFFWKGFAQLAEVVFRACDFLEQGSETYQLMRQFCGLICQIIQIYWAKLDISGVNVSCVVFSEFHFFMLTIVLIVWITFIGYYLGKVSNLITLQFYFKEILIYPVIMTTPLHSLLKIFILLKIEMPETIFFVLEVGSTVTHKIFESNSSFHVKYRTLEKV